MLRCPVATTPTEILAMVVCSDCGTSLDHLPSQEREARAPCPECGSLRRTFEETITHRVTPREILKAKHNGQDVSYWESVRADGRAAAAGRLPDGKLSSSIVGGSPQNEATTLEVCRLLVKKLNAQGASWGDPVLETQDGNVDASATAQGNESRKLLIQVTRAIHGTSASKALNDGCTVDLAPTELTDKLKGAIEHKSSRISDAEKAKLTLALDATLLPAALFEDVLETFVSRHMHWASEQGFQAIWLVGPPNGLVVRLDRR